MSVVRQAIEKAYQAHITSLYKVLSQAILMTDGNEVEILAAEEIFKKGMEHAENVKTRALAAAGL